MWLGVIFVGGAVGRCLGGPGSGEAIAACHEAARYAAWGPLASPLSWAIAIAAGWLAIAAIDARRHRRQAGDR